MKFFLAAGLSFVAISSIGCGFDARANTSANHGRNTNVSNSNGANVAANAANVAANTAANNITTTPTPAKKEDEGAFSFPPPSPTDYAEIQAKDLINPAGATNLLFVADRIAAGLKGEPGYSGKYKVFWNDQNEFAIVTVMERISEDGSPLSEPERWENSESLPEASSADEYRRFLLGGKKVYYRVFAFVVTAKWHQDYFNQNAPPTFATAQNWTHNRGSKRLGDGSGVIESVPFVDKYRCFALLYLFVNHTSLDGATSVDSLRDSEKRLIAGLDLTTGVHLAKTKVPFRTE